MDTHNPCSHLLVSSKCSDAIQHRLKMPGRQSLHEIGETSHQYLYVNNWLPKPDASRKRVSGWSNIVSYKIPSPYHGNFHTFCFFAQIRARYSKLLGENAYEYERSTQKPLLLQSFRLLLHSRHKEHFLSNVYITVTYIESSLPVAVPTQFRSFHSSLNTRDISSETYAPANCSPIVTRKRGPIHTCLLNLLRIPSPNIYYIRPVSYTLYTERDKHIDFQIMRSYNLMR